MQAIRNFAREFSRDPLYDTGFYDIIAASNLAKVETREDTIRALAFIAGAAYVARLANVYMSKQWERCDWLHTACGVLTAKLEQGASEDTIRGLLDTYRRALT